MDIFCEPSETTTDLCKIMEKHGSDKASFEGSKYYRHNYTLYYNSLFSPVRTNSLNVFEMGLGTTNSNVLSNMGADGIPGASLRGWMEYFPNSNIYGGDIDADILFEDTRIKTFYCDQLDPTVIESMWSRIELNFDIILDDGLHQLDSNICLFENSFHKLKVGGVYIIEDVNVHNIHKYYRYLNKWKKMFDIEVNPLILYHPNNDNDNCLIIIKKLS